MDSRDREAISDLFRKLHEVERQAGPRDAEAERLIADETQRMPGSPYYMAQTIVMQDMALQAKQQELDTLKQRFEQGDGGRDRPSEGGGGFLSRMFGGGGGGNRPQEHGTATRGGPWNGAQPAAAAQPYGQPPQNGMAPAQQYAPQGRGFGGGGGFLAGAAQTAMGVAGGVVLGNAIGSMFGGGGLFGGAGEQVAGIQETATNAIEQPQEALQQAADDTGPADEGYQEASYDDGGDFEDV